MVNTNWENQYTEIGIIDHKKDWKIVKSKEDGILYIVKKLSRYNFALYTCLKNNPHPNIVRIKECYQEDSVLYVIEEYVQGQTLATILENKMIFSEKDTIRINIMLCKALHHLHTLSDPIIHRDIKPSNVMLDTNNQIKLIDFDVSRFHNEENNMDTTILGTEGFASPEQFGFSQTDARSDIYSLGVLMNYMLTMMLPKEMIYPGRLEECIKKCIHLDPKDRYPDMIILKQTLQEILDGDTEVTVETTKKVIVESRKNKTIIPGFRTGKKWKMLISVCGYILIMAYFFTSSSKQVNSIMRIIERITSTVMLVTLVGLWTNFLQIQSKLEFFDSQKQVVRIWGYVLYTIIILFVYGAIMTILGKIFV